MKGEDNKVGAGLSWMVESTKEKRVRQMRIAHDHWQTCPEQ